MDSVQQFEQKLKAWVSALKNEFQTLRSNRPTPRLVEDIKVDYYGQLTPVKAIGSISVVPPRDIQIGVWDKEAINAVAKAVEAALNISANIDGNLIRVTLPTLTEERRKELEKIVRKMAEENRIKIRGARDEINKELKKMEGDKKISEDSAFKKKEETQKFVDKANKEIEELLENKIKEIFG